jgi:hypothetical protein
MKRLDDYSDAPSRLGKAIDEAKVIADFLPPPDELILDEDGVTVSITLSERSVAFFRRHARTRGVAYDAMIRRVLDLYARHFEEAEAGSRAPRGRRRRRTKAGGR